MLIVTGNRGCLKLNVSPKMVKEVLDSVIVELLSWVVRRGLKKIRLRYELEEVLVVPQADSKTVKLPGLEEIVMEKGKALKVSRGIASHLADSGWVKIGEDHLATKDISSMRWLESSEESLIKLPDFFYLRAAKLLKEGLGKAVEIQNDLQEIIDMRLRKLVKLVFLRDVPTNILERLQPEEVLLFNLLREALNTWKREVMYTDGGQ
jgi:hypothetical protein